MEPQARLYRGRLFRIAKRETMVADRVKNFAADERCTRAAVGILKRIEDADAFLARVKCCLQTTDVEIEFRDIAKRGRRIVRIAESPMLGQRGVEQYARTVEVETLDRALACRAPRQRGHPNTAAAIEMRCAFEIEALRVPGSVAQLLRQREMPDGEAHSPSVVR